MIRSGLFGAGFAPPPQQPVYLDFVKTKTNTRRKLLELLPSIWQKEKARVVKAREKVDFSRKTRWGEKGRSSEKYAATP